PRARPATIRAPRRSASAAIKSAARAATRTRQASPAARALNKTACAASAIGGDMSSDSDIKSLAVEQPSALRRDFLDGAIVGGMVLLAGSAAYPIVRYLSAPVAEEMGSLEVVAAKVNDVQAGTALAFRFGDKPAILVRDQDGKLHGLIAICTHL